MINTNLELQVNAMLRDIEEFENAAREIYERLCKIDPEQYKDWLVDHGTIHFTHSEIELEGEEMVFGDTYNHYARFPTSWLYDNEWEQAAIAAAKKRKGDRQRAEAGEKTGETHREQALLKKLKAKYEG